MLCPVAHNGIVDVSIANPVIGEGLLVAMACGKWKNEVSEWKGEVNSAQSD